MKRCVAEEVGQASSVPVLGASCLKFLEGRDNRTPRRGWKPLELAGGDGRPAAPAARHRCSSPAGKSASSAGARSATMPLLIRSFELVGIRCFASFR